MILQLKNVDTNDTNSPLRKVTLSWNEHEITNSISSFCKIETAPQPVITEQIWSSTARGSESHQIFRPHGLTIDKETNDIYIADCYNKRIQVFNESGQHIKCIFNADILNPHRLLIVANSIFVTDLMNRHIYKLNKQSDEVELSEELEYVPGGLHALGEEIYVVNFSQPIIYLYDIDLYKEGQIILKSSTSTDLNNDIHFLDIRFVHKIIYVLLENYFYRFVLFDFDGNTLSCLIPSALVSKAFYFCIDSLENILISSWEDNQVLVFSKGGQLKCKIGNCIKSEPNTMVHPRGLDLMSTGILVVCDNKNSTYLHSYAYLQVCS